MIQHADKMIFVTGIDTDAGKSYATGWLARHMMESGLKVATMKFIQTGNTGRSEDIEVHRRIMGTGPLPEDADLTTAPQIFSYPASPHLAAAIDRREIDFDRIDSCAVRLAEAYDVVLIEGAGGPMVPLTETMMTIDYPASRSISAAVVTNARLGSISHTILTLEALRSRSIKVGKMLFNHHFDTDPVISPDTRRFIGRYMQREFPDTELLDVPTIV